MATKVHEEGTISLIDGTTIQARPLKVSLLKDFLKTIDGLAEVAEDNEKSMNLLLDCVQIALKQYQPELSEDRAALEDNIDLPTVYKIVEAASGINLTDPTAIINAVANK